MKSANRYTVYKRLEHPQTCEDCLKVRTGLFHSSKIIAYMPTQRLYWLQNGTTIKEEEIIKRHQFYFFLRFLELLRAALNGPQKVVVIDRETGLYLKYEI